jgi:hypothetical protein
MTTTRCCIMVKDPISRRTRKCQKNVSRYTRCICSTHARISVIKIQARIRSYILRKKLKTFSLLPCDVWNHVLYYMRYQHHIKQCFQKSIDNIYSTKIINLRIKINTIIINGSIYEADSEEIKIYRKYSRDCDNLIYNRNCSIEMINTRGIIIIA